MIWRRNIEGALKTFTMWREPKAEIFTNLTVTRDFSQEKADLPKGSAKALIQNSHDA